MKNKKRRTDSVKCKYCDYENEKDAIVCECCGASLSSQRSAKDMKKESARRVRADGKKRIPNIRALFELSAERFLNTAEGTKKRSKKRIAVLSAAMALLLAALALSLLLPAVLKGDVSGGEDLGTGAYIKVYDPEANVYRFLKDGRLIEGSMEYDTGIYHGTEKGFVCFSRGTPAEGQAQGEQPVLSFVTEDRVKNISLAGIVKDSDLFASGGVTKDGEFAFFAVKEGAASTENMLYACDRESDSLPFPIGRITAYSLGTLDNSRIFFVDSSSSEKKLTVYDIKSGERDTVCEADGFLSMTYYEDAKILVYLTRLGELGIYRPDSKSTVKITERNAAEYVFSPDYSTLLYTETATYGKSTLYLYKDGISTALGEEMFPFYVSNGGDVVYAVNKEKDVIYSSHGGEAMKTLGEGAYILLTTEDKRQIIFRTSEGLYLSMNGEYSHKIYKNCNISAVTPCEDSFIGEIFYINMMGGTYVCRLKKDLSFEVIEKNASKPIYLENERAVIYRYSGMLWRISENRRKKAECMIFGYYRESIMPDGRSAYIFDGPLVYSKNKSARIIEKEIKSFYPFGDGGFYIKLPVPKRIEDAETEQAEQTQQAENASAGARMSAGNTYEAGDLYYTKNGSKGKLIMKNAVHVEIKNGSIYVFAKSEKKVEGYEGMLYDVYAGNSVHGLELVISGVRYRFGQ